MNIQFTFRYEDKKDDVELSKEVIESRGYKRAVKSFQIKYPNIKQAIVSWIKEGRPLSKVQKLPMGRKKKLGGYNEKTISKK